MLYIPTLHLLSNKFCGLRLITWADQNDVWVNEQMSTCKSKLSCAFGDTFHDWHSEWELTASKLDVTIFAPKWVSWRLNWALPDIALFSMFLLHAVCSTGCLHRVHLLWRLYPLLVNFVHFVAAQKQTWHVCLQFQIRAFCISHLHQLEWLGSLGGCNWWMHRQTWIEQPHMSSLICLRCTLQECQHLRGHQEHGQGIDTWWFTHLECHGRWGHLAFSCSQAFSSDSYASTGWSADLQGNDLLVCPLHWLTRWLYMAFLASTAANRKSVTKHHNKAMSTASHSKRGLAAIQIN